MSEAGKVLVLGASGFFGGWISIGLEGAGYEVVKADRREGGDLLDPAGLRRLIAEAGPDAVVNAAGMTSPADARSDPASCFSANVGGVLNLLEAVRLEARGAQVVALSSAAVYAGEPPFTETAPTAATTPYAASKQAMETLCGQYTRGHQIPVTVLRCFNLIGPGEPDTQVSSEFCRAALTAREMRAEVKVGEPATARDFTDVRDAARAVRLLLDHGPAGGLEPANAPALTGTFNLCSGRAVSLAKLAETIGRLAGVELTLRGSGSGRPASGLLAVSGDAAKLREATGWEPEVELEASLADLLASLRP